MADFISAGSQYEKVFLPITENATDIRHLPTNGMITKIEDQYSLILQSSIHVSFLAIEVKKNFWDFFVKYLYRITE